MFLILYCEVVCCYATAALEVLITSWNLPHGEFIIVKLVSVTILKI